MATPPFTIEEFRTNFPEFANETEYPDSVILFAYNESLLYFDATCVLSDPDLQSIAAQLATAFVLELNSSLGGGGNTPGIVDEAEQGDVRIGLAVPDQTYGSAFFNQNGYGARLWAIMVRNGNNAGGYVGGTPNRNRYCRW